MTSYRNSVLGDIFETTVYHSGDFKYKAEPLGSMTGGRSTGYFGTGYYFVRNPKKLDCGDYSKRPIYELDVSDCNLAFCNRKHHDALKTISQYIGMYPIASLDLQKLWSLSHELVKACIPWNRTIVDCWHSDFKKFCSLYYEDDFRQYLDEDFSGTLDLLREVPFCSSFLEKCYVPNPDWEELHYEFDSVDSILDPDIHEIVTNLRLDLRYACSTMLISESDFQDIAKEIYESLSDYYIGGYLNMGNRDLENTDSLPTRFMKALGYEGVYPASECDNTTFGGCLYSLDNVKSIVPVNELAKRNLMKA